MQQVKAQNVSGCSPGYEIEQSLMFNVSEQPYLTRTAKPNSNGGGQWTMSFWMKNPAPPTLVPGGAVVYNMGGQNSYPGGAISGSAIRFYDDGTLSVGHDARGAAGDSFSARPGKNGVFAKFNDPSAWYHFCIVFDANIDPASERIKFYVNGERLETIYTYGEVKKFQGTWFLSQGGNNIERVGNISENVWNYAVDGYLAEFHAISGQVVPLPGPEHFAVIDSCGTYSPIPYEGDYGETGFHLQFEASNIGADNSVNAGDFTTNGLTSSYVFADTPTNNFPYFNTLWSSRGTDRAFLPRNYYQGNTMCFVTGNSYFNQPANWALPKKGAWYWETQKIRPMADDPTYWQVGVFDANQCVSNHVPANSSPQITAYFNGGNLVIGSSYGSDVSTSWSSPVGRWVGIMVDMDNQEFSVWDDSGKVLGYSTVGYVGEMFPVFGRGGNNSGNNVDKNKVNFGQFTFDLTQPPESKMLCSKNLPDPRVKPGKNFKATAYDGTDTEHFIETGFTPNLVWTKERNGTSSNVLQDSSRGWNKFLMSDQVTAEADTGGGDVNNTSANGYTLWYGNARSNKVGGNYISWSFKGGDTVTNNDGYVPSEVSVNKDMGFSIVKWTGTGDNTAVGHGLGAVPSMVIAKSMDDGYGWVVQNAETWVDTSTTGLLYLNTNAAAANDTNVFQIYPTAANIYPMGGYWAGINALGKNYVAYCFANTEMLQVGSYTGNGLVDGPFIGLPFQPAFFMVKAIDQSGESWWIFDGARTPYNIVGDTLKSNTSDAEVNIQAFDFLSNGVKIRGTQNAWNQSAGKRYLYLAIAEETFKQARGR